MIHQSAVPSPGAAYALELRGIRRVFGALVALKDINLHVRSGERKAVLGANGAGKTTLFNAITGDYLPTAGLIRFFGEDITTLTAHERIRRGLRRTYQNSLLFKGLTVRENFFLAVRGVSRSRFSLRRCKISDSTMRASVELMDWVHLSHLADTSVSHLSHGQQRQLEIGMALAGAPRLILFDEPAAGLSPAERGELVDILVQLPSRIGYIIIEHDLEVALRVVESCTIMDNGTVFKEGSPEQIEADPEVQRIYLGGGYD